MKHTDIKTVLPNYCDTATTKEIAEALNITTARAYKLCTEAEQDGWLYKFGYRDRDGVIQPLESFEQQPRTNSLVWQNVQE